MIDRSLRPRCSARRIGGVLSCSLLLHTAFGHAQEIEPRAYSNAPIGMNFLILGHAHSEGGVVFDPAAPLKNAEMNTDLSVLAYARVFEIAGQSARFDAILPYGRLDGSADYQGREVTRNISGMGDPRLRLSMNFTGAPALGLKEFGQYRQDLIVGGSVQVALPLGQYDADKLINIGSNRWFIKPELGISKAWGPWTVELLAAVTFFGDNDDFFGGKRREQDAVQTVQGHLIYAFGNGLWTALTAAHLSGGRTTLDGVRGNDLQKNSRIGLTLALPVDRKNSIKMHVENGVSTRTGNDFDTLGIAWQHRWGSGL